MLAPYEAKVVVVGSLPAGVAAPEPSLAAGRILEELGGDWTVDLNGKQLTTLLKSWEDLGARTFTGPATYRKQFTVAALPAGKRVFLEIGAVHDYARVKLNGKELEAHAWQPYRWDVTSAVKPGANDLEIQVHATPAGGRGGGAAGGTAQASAATPNPNAAGGRGANAQAVSGAQAPTGGGGGGRGRGNAALPASGLLGPVNLVAH